MHHLGAADLLVLLLSLGTLLATARLFGELAQRWRQPAVLGEILAGVVLGPTLLGRFFPEWTAALFPASGPEAVVFEGLRSFGITLFLFVAGMEVQLSTVWRRSGPAMAVAASGLLIPFSVAWLAAWWQPAWVGWEPATDWWFFAAFFATAASISALPLIAKILMDLRLYRTEFGMTVIAAAVLDDLAGWLIFAVLLSLMGTASPHGMGIGGTLVGTLLFAGGMLTVGRWAVRIVLARWGNSSAAGGRGIGLAVAFALGSAAVTEWIGVHAVFGAFLAGVVVGDAPQWREEARAPIREFVTWVLAPLYFASVSLQLDFVAHFTWPVVLSVLTIACVGKIVGCGVTARWTGSSWKTAWALGFAMNARGAMEIILGSLALRAGLIGERMFVALVIMALVTSAMSGPVIQRLLGGSAPSGPGADPERQGDDERVLQELCTELAALDENFPPATRREDEFDEACAVGTR